jgi:hypothetical protein
MGEQLVITVAAGEDTTTTCKCASNPSMAFKKKKSIDNYYFYIESTKQASNYKIMAEFVVNHVKSTFDWGNKISKLLQNLQAQDTTK